MRLSKIRDIIYSGLFLLSFVFVACSNETAGPVNPEELINSVRLYFINTTDRSEVITATFQDLDGSGGDLPLLTHPMLTANTNYDISIQFLNELENPAEDVTLEVSNENLVHQVFYVSEAGLNLIYAYNDRDINGNPTGLFGTIMTGAVSTGNLTISLIHEGFKNAPGVSDGDPTNTSGKTDIEVTFNVTIQ